MIVPITHKIGQILSIDRSDLTNNSLLMNWLVRLTLTGLFVPEMCFQII